MKQKRKQEHKNLQKKHDQEHALFLQIEQTQTALSEYLNDCYRFLMARIRDKPR